MKANRHVIIVLGAALIVALILLLGRQRMGLMPHPAGSSASGAPSVSPGGTPVAVSPSSVPPPSITDADRKTLTEINEIMASKNDNDPRLDHDFTPLSDGAKYLLERRYAELPPESRNERGTIVYLIGRDLSASTDFGFLKQVLSEGPCLSLQDCKQEQPAPNPGDEHHESTNDVTLAYPQLVALNAAEAYLFGLSQRGEAGKFTADAFAVIDQGLRSPIPRVVTKANELQERFSNLRR